MLSPITNQPTVVHRTVAHRGETENIYQGDECWEFNCPHCDYRASYVRSNSALVIGKLTIWNAGDPSTRHHNSFASEQREETWLTPALRQQMESLLEDVNLDF